jgi:hypothetical protein
MDAYRIEDCIAQASIGMTRGQHVRIDDGRGIEIAVAYGSLWVTQQNDPNDICIGTGESFRIERDGLTMLIATQASLCTVTPPVGKTREELRVSMITSGAKPVPLFDADANPKPSRLDAWLDKYWVPLFSASARPTTAAL